MESIIENQRRLHEEMDRIMHILSTQLQNEAKGVCKVMVLIYYRNIAIFNIVVFECLITIWLLHYFI